MKDELDRLSKAREHRVRKRKKDRHSNQVGGDRKLGDAVIRCIDLKAVANRRQRESPWVNQECMP